MIASSQSSDCVAIEISKDGKEKLLNLNMHVLEPQNEQQLTLPVNDGMYNKIIEMRY